MAAAPPRIIWPQEEGARASMQSTERGAIKQQPTSTCLVQVATSPQQWWRDNAERSFVYCEGRSPRVATAAAGGGAAVEAGAGGRPASSRAGVGN